MQLDRLQRLRAAKALGWQALPPLSVVALALLVWEYLIPLGIVPGVRAQYLGTPSGVAAAAAELSDKGYGGHGLFAHVRATSAANRHGFRRRGLHRRAAGHRATTNGPGRCCCRSSASCGPFPRWRSFPSS